ncbi:uncharacterized protein LOC117207168 [Bombus bifarius]|uniref:Uncharacterized protein LOC117207168 n=1 Tax=Bombus bifarius TaxID=103933 RepID=A0A6P8LQL0_9HYME|nr:uncharacterized protein LOC117207168 [Bombus bifarius]
MDRQVITTKLLFLILLLFASSVRAKDHARSSSLTPNEAVKPVEEFVEESSTEDQFSLESATTTESATTVQTYRKLTLSINARKNISREFRPSVHLGEIKESRISNVPFNAVHHFNFDNGVDPASYHRHLKDFQIVFQPTAKTLQTLQAGNQGNSYQNLFETVVAPTEESKKDGTTQNGYVKFQDDGLDAVRVEYDDSSKDQAFHQQFSHSVTENMGAQYDSADQQIFQNLEKPVFDQQTSTVWGKPSKFQAESEKHEGSFSKPELNADPLKMSHYTGFYDHQNQQQSNLKNFELFRKPSNGVVYVQESSFLTTRKYPYPIYQPHRGYHQVDFINDERPSYPVKKRVSVWKKIFHLIGAILPLGLLIAALTPNVVKVDNTTQPNIVLSKWRVADLPVEHKHARYTDPFNDCEERSICDMILAGGDAGSTVLQNILWNLATRTSTTMAKESGLHDVFEAVKKKDCTNVLC